MPGSSTSIEWSRGLHWRTPEGLAKLRTLVRPSLPYEPHDWQLTDSAHVLDGQDVFCITATGDGKSALIYIPALARKEMITIVVPVEPTNALESNIASSLRSKGLSSVVINAETLAEAARSHRDLWEEARNCQYQVIATSPENPRSPRFNELIQDPKFRARWGVLAVDEAHLVADWGDDFRKAYAEIWTLRSRAPDHLTFLAMSASVEPGRHTNEILRCLGFTEGTYLLDRRDCEQHNVNFVFRDLRFAFTGHKFRDLDWLIPEDMRQPSDLEKWIVYCDTIEDGHRVTLYL
ncbi:hypothetical protein BV25DRAFT_1798449, partial [Artomyces pyxidatus]